MTYEMLTYLLESEALGITLSFAGFLVGIVTAGVLAMVVRR